MIHRLTQAALLSFTCGILPASAADADTLATIAERSGFQKTGRYDEVVQLCAAYQKAYPGVVRCVKFGLTPEGRPMLALVATRTGVLTATEARKQRIPVMLVQGGIHSGEIDGKDAGFLALREALDGRAARGALEKQVLIFVPVFNIDGHERFGKWNRPNQRGPEEMGWRTSGQNYNLNRDYAKADTPEMQAMLRLVNEWDPLAYIDLHVTDGAKFEHDIAVLPEPVNAGDIELRKAGRAMRDAVVRDLAVAGSLPLTFYPSFKVADYPASGFDDGVSSPRFSNGYFLTRNRFGMLVETHSWKDYPTRVRITRNLIISLLEQVAKHGQAWLATALAADSRSAKAGGTPVTLSWKVTDKSSAIEFRGYEYTRTQSEISGALMTRYDETRPQIWKLNIRDEIVPDLVVTAPKAGYYIPAAHAEWMARKLAQHGIVFTRVNKARAEVVLETFRATTAQWSAAPTEGHHRLSLTGAWKSEKRTLEPGSLFVTIAQPKSALVMSLLEPLAPDSLVSWGAFNNAFERKEYMDDYVAEDVARAQLAADPALAAEFKNKLAADATFAKSPALRLEFFYRRHSS
ncbi:MAG: M14 family metallopeptidase, partial [Betaproteobacteria bacterium]